MATDQLKFDGADMGAMPNESAAGTDPTPASGESIALAVDTVNLPGSIETPAPIVSDNTAPSPEIPVKRGRGRPRKQETIDRLNSVTPAPPKPAPIPTPVAVRPHVDYVTLGKIAGNLWFNVGVIIFGKDWEPETEEIPMVASAFKDYFEAEGISYISPSWQLGIVLGSYTLARVQRPTVKTRFEMAVAWIKSKFQR